MTPGSCTIDFWAMTDKNGSANTNNNIAVCGGGTHAIHHFAVKEPFYIRQWNAGIAHQVMREMGVRFNDFGTFLRANRLGRPTTAASGGDNPRATAQGRAA